MNRKTGVLFGAVAWGFLASSACLYAWPQTPLSGKMGMAIQHYEAGEDDEAMDLFINIVVRGDPAEKALATDYLNRLTRRMAHGEHKVPPATSFPSTTAPPGKTLKLPPRRMKRKPRRAELGRPPATEEAVAPEERTELMRREISLKIENRRKELLDGLRALGGVRVLEQNGIPLAIGIDPRRLFRSGVSFRFPLANKILSKLSALIFTAGKAQVVLLPENFTANESTVLDMRRAMAVNSYILKQGISPARVRVQLLGRPVHIPAGMSDYGGVLGVFIHGVPLSLEPRGPIDEYAGPPVSLGMYPRRINLSRGEGAIIEFSVMENPVGLASWKFEMLMPVVEGSSELGVLQEVVGDGPAFHQIYWNGRKNFFGAALPMGRYTCVLKARDLKGRETVAKETLLLMGRPGKKAPEKKVRFVEIVKKVPKRPGLKGRAKTRPAQMKSGGEPFEEAKPKRKVRRAKYLVKKPRRRRGLPAGGRAGTTSLPRKRPGEKRAVAGKPGPGSLEAGPPLADASSTGSAGPSQDQVGGTLNYTVYFAVNSIRLTRDGEKPLLRVSADLKQYPLAKLNLVGYAYKGEPKAADLARKRAEVVFDHLSRKYRIDPGRIQIQSAASDSKADTRVDIYISQ